MAEIIREILERRDQLRQLQQSTSSRPQSAVGSNGERLDLSAEVPELNQSISVIESRLTGLMGLVAGLDGIEDISLVPSNFMVGLRDNLQGLINHEDALQKKLDEIEQNDGWGTLDPQGFVLQSKNQKISLNLKELLKPIPAIIDKCLHNYYLSAIVLKGEGYQKFSAMFDEFGRQMRSVRELRQELEQVRSVSTQSHEQMQQLQAAAKDIKSEVERLRGESDSERKSIHEHLDESTAKIASIRETSEEAGKLSAAVQAYQTQFEQFQAQLDSRNKQLSDGKEEQGRLFAKVHEIEKEIERLNAQAEDMLTGATVAGLASEFGGLRNKLNSEVRWARYSFYAAILILFVSALPLAAFVFPWLGEQIPGLAPTPAAHDGATPWEFLGQVLVRAILLLPGAWFAKCTAGRHAALFRLREHYSYKYSVAASVEGFKKQAKPYADEIAAVTFFELTSNPADHMEGKGRGERAERHPNPLMEKLMQKFGLTQDGKST